jgi:hypothetical protein
MEVEAEMEAEMEVEAEMEAEMEVEAAAEMEMETTVTMRMLEGVLYIPLSRGVCRTPRGLSRRAQTTLMVTDKRDMPSSPPASFTCRSQDQTTQTNNRASTGHSRFSSPDVQRHFQNE